MSVFSSLPLKPFHYLLLVNIIILCSCDDTVPTLDTVSNFKGADRLSQIFVVIKPPIADRHNDDMVYTVYVGAILFNPADLKLKNTVKKADSSDLFSIEFTLKLGGNAVYITTAEVKGKEDANKLQSELKAFNESAELKDSEEAQKKLKEAAKEITTFWDKNAQNQKQGSAELKLKVQPIENVTETEIKENRDKMATRLEVEIEPYEFESAKMEGKLKLYLLENDFKESETSAQLIVLGSDDNAITPIVGFNNSQAAQDLFKAVGGNVDVPFYQSVYFIGCIILVVVLIIILIACICRSKNKNSKLN